MKGIPIFRLKRLKRTAVLLGAGALVAGASLLGAAQANAAVGTQPGALTISPPSGATTATMTYATTTACPAGNQGSAVVRLVDPGGQTPNLSQVNNSVAAPFSGALTVTFAQVIGLFPDVVGATTEVAVYCFPSASAVGTPVAVQDTFVTIDAAGANYSTGTSSGPAATTTTLTASPNPAVAGQTVTLTATVADGGSTPTGSVQFSVGGTAINSPVTLNGSGVATTTTSFAAPGTESLLATYTPTGSFSGSSGPLSLTVNTPPANTIPLATTVGATGAFSLTVDSTTVVTVPPGGTTAPTTPIVVTDTRNTFPGWSVSGQDSNWTGSGTAAGASFSGNQLGWTPTNVGTLPQGVTLGPPVPPGTNPGLGSAAQVLASVHAGIGNGFTGASGATFGANLALAIPAGQAAGPYTSGLSITAVDTNP